MNLKRHILFAVFLSTVSVMQAADLPETFPAEQVTKYSEIKSAFDAFEAKIQLPDAAMSEALWNEWKALRIGQLRWIQPIFEKAESVAQAFDLQSGRILNVLYRLQDGLNPRRMGAIPKDFPEYLENQLSFLVSNDFRTTQLVFATRLGTTVLGTSPRTESAAVRPLTPMTPMRPAQPVVTVSRPDSPTVSVSTPLRVPELPASLRLPVQNSKEPESLAGRVARIAEEGRALISRAEQEGARNPTVLSDTVAGLGEDVSNACKRGLAHVARGLRKIF